MDWRVRNCAGLLTAALLLGCETLSRQSVPAATAGRSPVVEPVSPEKPAANLPASWRDRRQSLADPHAIAEQAAPPTTVTKSSNPKPQPTVPALPPPASVAAAAGPRGGVPSMAPPKPGAVLPARVDESPPVLSVKLAPARSVTSNEGSTSAPGTVGAPNQEPAAHTSIPEPLELSKLKSDADEKLEGDPVASSPIPPMPLAPPPIDEGDSKAATASPPPPAPVRPVNFLSPESAREDTTTIKFTEKSTVERALALTPAPAEPGGDPTVPGADSPAPTSPKAIARPATQPPPEKPMPSPAPDEPAEQAPPVSELAIRPGAPAAASPAPAPLEKPSRPDPAPATFPAETRPPTEQRSFEVTGLALCEEIAGFGDYRPYAGKSVKPGQQLLLYAEVRHFTSKEVAGLFETRLETELFIEASPRAPVHIAFDPIVDRCQALRSDFYCRYTFRLPDSLAPGTYRLRVVIEDHNGGASAEQTLRLAVAPSR